MISGNLEDIVLQKDIDSIAKWSKLEKLAGSTVLVTGATGLIGSQLCRALLRASETRNLNIHVIAGVRNREKAEKLLGSYKGSGLEFLESDIMQPIRCDKNVDYIIHTASPTSSRYFVSHPVETLHQAVIGSDQVLKLAFEKKVQSMVYLSSLEVYGTPQGQPATVSETDYGYIDPLNIRSCYSEGKRAVECLCSSYASEYRVPVRIVRLAQTFGPGVEYNDGRVFAEFARNFIENRDIVLHTQGRTVRSYCYTADAVKAILTVLLFGKDAEAYNVCNMDTSCSIYEMAELVCNLDPQKKISVKIQIPDNVVEFGYNPEMVIRLDTDKINALGWHAEVGLKEMFERLIASMQQRKEL